MTEKQRETKIEAIRKTYQHLGGENKKRESAAIRSLRKYPNELLIAAGVNPSDLPSPDVVKTLHYGTLGRMYSATENWELEMRATDEYYNSLARATVSQVKAYNAIVDGPLQQQVRSLSDKISAEYDAIRLINQKQRKKVQSPAVQAHLDKITELKVERKPFFEKARKERKDALKAHKAELSKIDVEIASVIRQERNVRRADLWHGNYRRSEENFALALAKATKDGKVSESGGVALRGEWKGKAEDFITNPRWDGTGSIGSKHSTLGHTAQRWENVVAGKNAALRVRPFLPSDSAAHGLKQTFRIDSRLYLVSIRLREGWVSLPVFLHRQPQPDARVVESTFVVRKEGPFRKTYFNMVVRSTEQTAIGSLTLTVVPVWEPQSDNSIIALRWSNGVESGTISIPSSIGRRLEHAENLSEITGNEHAAYLQERKNRGLSIGSYNALRYISHSAELKPKSGAIRENLSAAAIRMRELEDTHGSHMGKHTTEFVDFMLEEMNSRFTFSSEAMAANFTTAWMFVQKYNHLYPWSVRDRAKALLHRREIYRIAAKKLLANTKLLRIPDTDYRSRNLSNEQRLVSPSELLGVLKNRARQQGVTVEEFSERPSAAPAAAGRSN